MTFHKLLVGPDRDRWPLEEFLADRFPEIPRSRIRRMLRGGEVQVAGRPGWLGRPLAPGETVTIDIEPAADDTRSPSLSFLLEEDAFAVLDKPARIPVVPDRQPSGPSVIELLAERRGEGRFWVVHRLDRDTTGVLLVARSAEAHRDLSLQFQNREVGKEYVALVCGELDEDAGKIELPIGHDPRTPMRMKADRRRGRLSLTRYEVEERFRDYTLVRVYPETGRTHQVRVHLAGIGHALAVDPTYGSRSEIHLSEIKPGYRSKRVRPERPLMDRLTLHARRLTFRHPGSGESVRVEAPIPEDLSLVLKMLRKYRIPPGDRSGAAPD